MAARHGTISPTLRAGVPFLGGLKGGGGGLAVALCTHPCVGGGRRWELRPAWPLKPGGVPWARGPLRGRTSDSPGGPPLTVAQGGWGVYDRAAAEGGWGVYDRAAAKGVGGVYGGAAAEGGWGVYDRAAAEGMGGI